MIVVHPLFVGSRYATEVWISDAAIEEFEGLVRRNRKLAGQLKQTIERFAQSGFWKWEGRGTLRDEGQRVWAIGRKADLFRFIGFYHAGKNEFVILFGYVKRGQKRGSEGNLLVHRAAQIRDNGEWRKSG